MGAAQCGCQPDAFMQRAITSDGLLETPHDVKVTVRRPGSAPV